MVPLTSTSALGYYLVSMFLTILGNILLSLPRCFPPGTQLPYDSNPVASGYVEECTCLSTCFRLVRIGFESQPTSLPFSSQSSLHAMNNKWHTKTKWKSNVSTKQIPSTWKKRTMTKCQKVLLNLLITNNIIRVHISDLNIRKYQNEGESEWKRRVCWILEVAFLVLLRCH